MRLFHRRRVTPAVLPPRSPAVAITTLAANVKPTLPTRPVGPRYLITYDRVGEWGRRGTVAPAPLTVRAINRDQLADAIRRDVRSYLPPGTQVTVIVDLALMAGQLRAGAHTAGTFGLQILPGGEPR